MTILKYTFTLITLFSFNLIIGQTFPVSSILNNGSDSKHINYVILGDGYTSSQQSTFITDATSITNDLFSQSPFVEYKNFFNVYAIEVPSNESGADHPGTATDVVEPAFAVQDVDNYFGSTFDAFGIHRLLVPMNSSELNNVLASNFPAYDQVMVIVNSPHYGGAGGWVATTSTNPAANEIAIHEIGHSFVGLSDEYWAGSQYANEKPNMTQETNPSLVKWSDWMNINDVGIYAYGGSTPQSDWHRPHQNCKMRYLGFPFCPVCSEAIIDQIYSLVTPIKNKIPAASNVVYNNLPLDFQVDLILPNPNTLSIEWVLNSTVINTTTNLLTLSASDLPNTNNTLTVTVTDNTLLSKSYAPSAGYTFSQSWNVVNNGSPISTNEVDFGNETSKFFFKAFPNPTTDILNINYFHSSSSTDAMVNIISVDGRISKSKEVELLNGEGQFQLNIEELPAGIYIVNINGEQLNTSFQIVKN
jgi:hypothetical protein